MQNFGEWKQKVISFREARDWKQFHNPKDMALSLVLEAAEVMEHFQWKSNVDTEKYLETHKDKVGEELADVLYWIILMSNDLDIDLLDALDKKMKQNEAKYPVEKSKGKYTKYDKL